MNLGINLEKSFTKTKNKMGQYFKAIIISPKTGDIVASLKPHDYRNGAKLMESSYVGNNFVSAVESLIEADGEFYKHQVVWAGDYADPELDGETLYNKGSGFEVYTRGSSATRYVINHSKKQYVDKEGLKIHPLPLLTCEGNGGGGGDFIGKDVNNIVGSWARDVISVSNIIPDNYTELIFDLNKDEEDNV